MNDFRKELVTPEGDTYIATSPREVNDLIFGSGYREATESSDDADTGTPKTVTRPTGDRPATSPPAAGEVAP